MTISQAVHDLIQAKYKELNVQLSRVLAYETSPFTQNDHYLQASKEKFLVKYRSARAKPTTAPMQSFGLPQAEKKPVSINWDHFRTTPSTSAPWSKWRCIALERSTLKWCVQSQRRCCLIDIDIRARDPAILHFTVLMSWSSVLRRR